MDLCIMPATAYCTATTGLNSYSLSTSILDSLVLLNDAKKGSSYDVLYSVLMCCDNLCFIFLYDISCGFN